MGENRPRGPRGGASGTREAIATAARAQFAEHGFQAPLRRIAEQAEVDPRLIQHYFGSKRALFVAVVDLPLDPAHVVALLLAADRRDLGRRLAELLVGALADPERRAVIVAIVRAAASEELAATLVRQTITERVLLPVAQAIGSSDTELRAALLGSQFVGLAMARHVVGIPPLADATPAALVAALAPVFQHYLTGDLG